jgi:hypothetical protein
MACAPAPSACCPGRSRPGGRSTWPTLRAGYGPVDDSELKLVEAIAAAMWNETRADRTLAEVMAAIPPRAPGRPHGGDLQEPRHALSLNTALRYLTATSMASQRARRAFLAHRKATRDGPCSGRSPRLCPTPPTKTARTKSWPRQRSARTNGRPALRPRR